MKVDYLILKILKYFQSWNYHWNWKCVLLLLYFSTCFVYGSESPERDCCDPKHIIIPKPSPPLLPTTTTTYTSIIPTGRSGKLI